MRILQELMTCSRMKILIRFHVFQERCHKYKRVDSESARLTGLIIRVHKSCKIVSTSKGILLDSGNYFRNIKQDAVLITSLYVS